MTHSDTTESTTTTENPFNKLTPAQVERLALLSEELGEAQQVVGKILRHGYDSHHPDRPFTNNRQELERELGDIVFAMMLLDNKEDINWTNIEPRVAAKDAKVWEFMHHNERPEDDKD